MDDADVDAQDFINRFFSGRSGWEEYRGCTRKVRYSEEPAHGSALRHYRCVFCGGYHLTSKPRTGRQKKPSELSR